MAGFVLLLDVYTVEFNRYCCAEMLFAYFISCYEHWTQWKMMYLYLLMQSLQC